MNMHAVPAFGELLKGVRKQKNITQQQLAQKLGVHHNTISQWERGMYLPDSKGVVLEVARHLCMDMQQTHHLLEASLTALSPYWQVPYPRNPFFTGREEELSLLHEILFDERTSLMSQPSCALSGLGGIGKTQTALEYAYRYVNEYSAVFWVSAETRESIVLSLVAIAIALSLPEKQEQDEAKVIAAVIRWFTNHSDWLLIFDNVEDPMCVKPFLPSARSGSLLFTSRRHSLGFATQTLNLKQMTPDEGTSFLLWRAGLLSSISSLDQLALAREIVLTMDGLPLALDQAGAYIDETGCSLSDYLQLFQSSQLRLLDEREAHVDHPLSVTRTFALAFEQLERSNALATNLLTVCAFLAPEDIPEAFFIEGAAYLGPAFETLGGNSLQFNEATRVLLAYSLLQRHAVPRTVTVHRLVQVVLRERLSEVDKRMWASRVLHTMLELFPSREEMQVGSWHSYGLLLPHVLACIALSDQWAKEEVFERITLRTNVATYLVYGISAHFAEAEVLFHEALDIQEHSKGSEKLLRADTLLGLGSLYKQQNKYHEAELLFQQALHIREYILGSGHPLTGEVFHRLAHLYSRQARYEESEALYLQALSIREQTLGSEHPLTAETRSRLATLYALQGKYEEAEPRFRCALQTLENVLGREHPDIARPLNNLAELYKEQGKYEKAEPLYQRVLSIWEQTLEPYDHDLIFPLHGLAELYTEQGKYDLAEPLFQRALHIVEQTLSPENLDVALPLAGLAELYTKQGKYGRAEAFFQRALQVRQQVLGSQHPDVAETLHCFAHCQQVQHHITEALELYQQALTIREQALGPEHLKTCATRTALHLLQGQD